MRIFEVESGYMAKLSREEYIKLKGYYKEQKIKDKKIFAETISEYIFKIVEKETGVSIDNIKSHKQIRDYVNARQLCQYLLKKYIENLSLSAIVRLFISKNRIKPVDHATVLYSNNVILSIKGTKDIYAKHIDVCEKKVEEFIAKKQKNSNLA